MKFTTLISVATALYASVTATPLEERSGTPLTQAQAEALLIPQGITASSTGGCTTKSNPSCTSYDGILSGTVDGVITLKNAAGLSSLLITGGTEVGHASGTLSHANGYKVDVRHQTQLDNYIKTTFTQIANRGDGFPQWRAASGNIYCDEGSHWDITYL
uniref:Peptidoglycan-binding domain 1 protein n=1 Tax=Moniliophthora roreri TaxID=221103 RepID=A0A0W0G2D6_MONRR